MADHGLIFRRPLVEALLDGRKGQTRRPITRHNSRPSGYRWTAEQWARLDFNHPNVLVDGESSISTEQYLHVPFAVGDFDEATCRIWPCYEVGDRVWVRETWEDIYGTTGGWCWAMDLERIERPEDVG